MRTSIIIACLIIYGFHNSVEAQTPLIVKANPTKSEITLYSGPDNMIGALLLLKDSSILVSNAFVKEDYYNGNYEVAELYIDDINLISTKRKGGKAAGAILGGVIGLGVGALAAWIAEPPATPSSGSFAGLEAKYGGGLKYGYLIPAGALIGGITGGIIGGIKIEIPLNGSMENYNRKKKKLGRYTVKYDGAPKY
jgi:hypothetical protein